MRVVQPVGDRGSLKWIQRAVNDRREAFDPLILAQLPGAARIEWRSPLSHDDYAEYRDRAFLRQIGHAELAMALADFWPSRGPQWDALALTDCGEVLLLEAKAHIDEIFSAGTQARTASRARIERALDRTVEAIGAKPLLPWTGAFYQMANRISHLYFLIGQGISARLVFTYFVGDREIRGPANPDEWRGAIHVAEKMLGLPSQHALRNRIIHVFVPIEPLI